MFKGTPARLLKMYELYKIESEQDASEWLELAKLAKIARPERFIHLIKIKNPTIDDGFAFALKKKDSPDILATAFLKRTLYDQNHSISLFAIATKPDLKGMGIGRILLEKIETIIKQHKATEIRLFTTTAYGFYEKCGYKKYGELTSETGIPRYYQYKTIE